MSCGFDLCISRVILDLTFNSTQLYNTATQPGDQDGHLIAALTRKRRAVSSTWARYMPNTPGRDAGSRSSRSKPCTSCLVADILPHSTGNKERFYHIMKIIPSILNAPWLGPVCQWDTQVSESLISKCYVLQKNDNVHFLKNTAQNTEQLTLPFTPFPGSMQV